MGIKCRLLGHKWNYCTCAVCGETRNSEHDWNRCVCKVCGGKRDSDHVWKNCKCEVCGKTAGADSSVHEWNGCKCAACGQERDSGHIWDRCKCVMCGKTRDSEHEFNDGGKCVVCGASEPLNRQNHLLFTKNPKALICIADCYGTSVNGKFVNTSGDKPSWDIAFSRRTEMDELIKSILSYAPSFSGINPNDIKLIRPADWHKEIIPMKISELTPFMSEAVSDNIKKDAAKAAGEFAINNGYNPDMKAHPNMGMLPDFKVFYIILKLKD